MSIQGICSKYSKQKAGQGWVAVSGICIRNLWQHTPLSTITTVLPDEQIHLLWYHFCKKESEKS